MRHSISEYKAIWKLSKPKLIIRFHCFNSIDDIKQSADDLDQAKQKINQKDFFIQSQAKKLQLSQAENEKLKSVTLDLEKQVKVCQFKKSRYFYVVLKIFKYLTIWKDLKVENSKLKFTSKDQTKRILDLRDKLAEMSKSVESKNELLRISASQIRILERNLSNFAQVASELREKEESQNRSKRSSESSSSFKNNEEVISALQVRTFFPGFRRSFERFSTFSLIF